MLKFLQNNLRPRIETLRARFIRLIEPRIHHYRFYTRAEKTVRFDGCNPNIPFNMPIDYYYMGIFLAAQIPTLKGEILELVTEKESPFLISALSMNFLTKNKYSSLSQIRQITQEELLALPDHACLNIIANHTLNEIHDPADVLAQMKRVLAPQGVILATLSAFAPPISNERSCLGFSPAAVTYLFEKEFSDRIVSVTGHGNVLAGRMLLSNQGTRTLPKHALDFTDPYFPIISCVKVSPKKIV